MWAGSLLAADPRVVWRGPQVNLLGTPSPDGAFLTYVDRGDLARRDLKTGVTQKLTQHSAQSKEFAYFSSVSRDSRWISYAWMNADSFYEMRIIPADGGEPRTVFRNPEIPFVQPAAWTADGKWIVTLLFRKDQIGQIALVPSGGGPPKILKSLSWAYPRKMDLSADGSTILYDTFLKDGEAARGVYELRVDGSGEARVLTETPGVVFAMYAPGGLVYGVERGGVLDVYQGQRVLAKGVERALPLGVTAGGTLYLGSRKDRSDVTVNGKPVSLAYPGATLEPAWSPNGKELAYLARQGVENFAAESRVIVVRSWEPDRERVVPAKLAVIDRLVWPEPGVLLAAGVDRLGQRGWYRVDALTGETSPGVAPDLPSRHSQPVETARTQSGEVLAIPLPGRINVPLGMDALVPGPPLTRGGVSLGRQLFRDTRLSRDGTVSCATCHRPDYAFTDAERVAVGMGGRHGERRTPRLANRAWGKSFFWDGRAATLEEQVLQPVEHPAEMGLGKEEAARRVGLTVGELRDALAAYVRTIVAGDAAYDRYIAGDQAALDLEQQQGLALFRTKGGCVGCHAGPNLTDEKLHGGMKTPSLRDVARSAPFTHDGSFGTLTELVQAYADGKRNGVSKFNLQPAEKKALVRFLESLNGVIWEGLDH